MRRVRIIGGGLTGVLAAFEAHRFGCTDITLHERFDDLGGVARTRKINGAEIRDGAVYFGPPGDAMVEMLQTQGVVFDVFENRYGSVSTDGRGGRVFTRDFGGPAIASDEHELRPYGSDLQSRIDAYPEAMRGALQAYCAWHLGGDLTRVHESAATPLAINRVYPVNIHPQGLAERKRIDPLWDELYGLPRGQWGRTTNSLASLPRGGFARMFDHCRTRLTELGVKIEGASLVSPRQALMADEDEVVVWAANPTPLFKPAGLNPPPLVRKSFATYTFLAYWNGPLPFYVQNFTAHGAVFRLYLYESGGQTLATAECVREADDRALRAEMSSLVEGFGGFLKIAAVLSVSVQPRWIYHSTSAIEGLGQLRGALETQMGGRFVAGAWEPYGKSAKYQEVRSALRAALRPAQAVTLRAAG